MKEKLFSEKYDFLDPVLWYIYPGYKTGKTHLGRNLKVREKNFNFSMDNFFTGEPDASVFLQNSIAPLLSPKDPLRLMIEKSKAEFEAPDNLFDKNETFRILKSIVNPYVKTYKLYSEKSKWDLKSFRSDLILSNSPDLVVFFDKPCCKRSMGKLQTVMLKTNPYSLDRLLSRGKIKKALLSKLKSKPSLSLSALEEVLSCVERISLPYNLRRFPTRYHPLLEKITDYMGFPPLASLKIKSEFLTGAYIVSWTK
ncbi:hypothetical protein JXA84_09120 [candidate division WOR-3 bacterium]|nr:hypothetical protein [candidate division WOR-3 bacterium]